jgi:hypothetical protein
LLNPSFLLAFVYILFIANPNRRWTATSPIKYIYFVDGLEKFCRQRWRATQDLKAEAGERWNFQEKLHLQDQEEINLNATHPREIIPQAKGRSCSTSLAWGVHSSQPWFEVCNMIHVKYILPHHRIKREELRENEAKKTQKLLHPSRPRINARLQRPKKMTKPKNKSTPKPRVV